MTREYLALVGRCDEAVLEINRAIQLARDSTVLDHNAGQIYLADRRYDEAIEQYSIALRLDPKFSTSNAFMVQAYIRKGMYDKAFELQMRYPQEMGDTTRSAIVNKLADSYRSNGVEGYLRELIATGRTSRTCSR